MARSKGLRWERAWLVQRTKKGPWYRGPAERVWGVRRQRTKQERFAGLTSRRPGRVSEEVGFHVRGNEKPQKSV